MGFGGGAEHLRFRCTDEVLSRRARSRGVGGSQEHRLGEVCEN